MRHASCLANSKTFERGVSMEKVASEKEKMVGAENGKKKKGFWQGFMNFLMMGGIIVVLIAAAGIFILVSYLTR